MRYLLGLASYILGRIFGALLPKKVESAFSIAKAKYWVGFVSWRLKSIGDGAEFAVKPRIFGGKHISIGREFKCLGPLRLEAFSSHNGVNFSPTITIGDNVSVNYDCHIASINQVEIGCGCLLASRVYISDHNHGGRDMESMKIPPSLRELNSKGPVVIEQNVWIGEGVCILPGVRIGRNSVIGANSVVTRNLPPFSIAAGVPAKVIRTVD